MATAAAELDALRRANLTPGSLADVYDVGVVIGKGGFATVRRGIERKTGEPVALKILNPKSYLSNPAQARMLFHEIETLRLVNSISSEALQCAHEDLATSSGLPRLTIVTQLCSGGELFDRIVKAGHFSESDAALLVRKLAIALDALHTANIIHRDMKPENILYSTPEAVAEPVIADFGLAKIVGKVEVHASLVGTPGYLSPEIIASRIYTPACDVWALGVILYILLCGYPPFYAEDNKALYEQIVAGAFEFHEDAWHEVSDSSKDLIKKMLTVDPAARLSMSGVLAHPWITVHAPKSVRHMDRAVGRLKVFNVKRKVKIAAMAAAFGAKHIAHARDLAALIGGRQFTTTELSALAVAFTRVAGAASTTVNQAQFRQVLSLVGVTASLPADRLFVLFDTDGNGDVDSREFLAGLARLHGDANEALRLCFSVFDADASGYLSQVELMSLLVSNGIDLGDVAADGSNDERRATRLADVFSRMDTDCDGRVSFDEFKRAIQTDAVVAEAILRPLRLMRESKPAA